MERRQQILVLAKAIEATFFSSEWTEVGYLVSFWHGGFKPWKVKPMTADDHVREVYAYFGLAVYCCQVLEHGIVNAMVILRLPQRVRFTTGDIDAFMDLQFENTLGKLIKNLRAELPFPSDLEELLTQALKTRNWLCHGFFRDRAVEFMTPAGRDKMLAELEDAQE